MLLPRYHNNSQAYVKEINRIISNKTTALLVKQGGCFLYYGVHAHIVHQCMQADVVLLLRYHPPRQEGIQHVLLLVKKVLLLLLFAEPLPLVGHRRKIQFHAISLL